MIYNFLMVYETDYLSCIWWLSFSVSYISLSYFEKFLSVRFISKLDCFRVWDFSIFSSEYILAVILLLAVNLISCRVGCFFILLITYLSLLHRSLLVWHKFCRRNVKSLCSQTGTRETRNVKHREFSLKREKGKTCFPPRILGADLVNSSVTFVLSVWQATLGTSLGPYLELVYLRPSLQLSSSRPVF